MGVVIAIYVVDKSKRALPLKFFGINAVALVHNNVFTCFFSLNISLLIVLSERGVGKGFLMIASNSSVMRVVRAIQ